MYEGHLPEGNAVQKHSAGELYPVIIVGYGDGTWRWVDEARKKASGRISHAQVVASAKYYVAARGHPDVYSVVRRLNYDDYRRECGR